MPLTTPNLALPYPVPADSVDVPRDVQALANKLDTYTSINPPLVAALPGSPIDGQIVDYQNATMAGLGVVWQLRYRAAAGGAYKWEYIGGGALRHEVPAVDNINNAAYVDGATPGPTVTVPLAGDYELDFGVDLIPSAAVYCFAAVKLGAAATADSEAIAFYASAATGGAASVGRRMVRTCAANDVLKMQYKNGGSGAFNIAYRFLFVTPIRVG